MIQEVRILVLDLMPASDLSAQLQEILEHCSKPILYVRREFTSQQRLYDLGNNKDMYARINDFSPDVIFLMLPSKYLKSGLSPKKPLIDATFGAPVIAVLDDNEPDQMVVLFKLGFADFMTPPLKEMDILPRIRRLIEHQSDGQDVTRILQDRSYIRKLKGKCSSFVEEVEKIPVVAKCSACVLISGETGTGKELFARAIHYLSPRASKPFVPASCGAIPLDLIENELFGHVRGAFTGADSNKRGLVQEAEGGTLFLDEVDCLPPRAQIKLLRFIQEKEYRQLGCAKIRHANVRIIAATNIDLTKEVETGKFRQDLFYRLNVIPLLIPPLRERRKDIPLIANHYLVHFAHQCDREVTDFSSEAMQKMLSYDWPGNVRELENVVERAVVFSQRQIIQDSDIILPRPAGNVLSVEPFREAKHRFVRTYIEKLLISHKGNISQAARAADKDRRAFFELMRKYKIEAESFRSDYS